MIENIFVDDCFAHVVGALQHDISRNMVPIPRLAFNPLIHSSPPFIFTFFCFFLVLFSFSPKLVKGNKKKKMSC